MDTRVYNLTCIFASLFALLTYTALSYILTLIYPSSSFKTQLAKNTSNTTLWIKKHQEKSDAASVVAAIQTLRNTIYVSIFVGGGAFQSAINVIILYHQAKQIEERIRIIILGLTLFISFLCWASTIRAASHLGYLTGVLGFSDSHPDEKSEIIRSEKTGGADDTSLKIDQIKESNNNNNNNNSMNDKSKAAVSTKSELTEEKRFRQESQMMMVMLVSFR
jgi:hypothetical protein